ncbi:hypothetical protein K488DRAFT_87345 [Vararia minispora EC-137]|uniref:Uncharacterized protein n=1 Tax=Vararia minispora EC-137 TaxID=1314806 RepID=A0ACB8QGV2_9AGAM|nr:hypothetical protein K488DRAFT_87345 [Vararia minispora EC-137]
MPSSAARKRDRSRRHSQPLPLLAARAPSPRRFSTSDALTPPDAHAPSKLLLASPTTKSKDEKARPSTSASASAAANEIDLPTLDKHGLAGVRRVDRRSKNGIVGRPPRASHETRHSISTVPSPPPRDVSVRRQHPARRHSVAASEPKTPARNRLRAVAVVVDFFMGSRCVDVRTSSAPEYRLRAAIARHAVGARGAARARGQCASR